MLQVAPNAELDSLSIKTFVSRNALQDSMEIVENANHAIQPAKPA
jgi:hypothetical protein